MSEDEKTLSAIYDISILQFKHFQFDIAAIEGFFFRYNRIADSTRVANGKNEFCKFA